MSDYQSNLAAQSQPKRHWVLTILIVGSTFLAAGSVFRALFYGPVHARWIIAHAANELAAQRVDSATSWLDKAYSASPDIASDRDYWRLRFEILTGKKPVPAEELDSFVDDAIDSIQRDADPAYRLEVASHVSRLLFNEAYFKQALTVLEKVFPPFNERNTSENNEIAYTRVIAQGDLELALKEINRALEDSRNNQYSQLFDTKAWILFKKGETEKALTFAQAAVREWYREIAAVNTSYALLLLPDDKFSLTKKEDKAMVTSPLMENEIAVKDADASPKPKKESLSQDNEPDPMDAISSIETALRERTLDSADLTAEDRNQPLPKSDDQTSKPSDPPSSLAKTISIGRDRGSYLHTTAVLRYHRACILDELNRIEEAQKDYYWLDAFGYTQTNDLY